MTAADMQTAIAHAALTEGARSLLALVVDSGEVCGTVALIAGMVGVTERTVYRAMVELERERLITRESTLGRSGSVRLTLNPDIDANLRRLCHGLGRRHEPPPGQEYTRLQDEEAARRDRARYCHATGTGPRWARELGAKMAKGEA